METLQGLQKRINTTGKLQSIVKSMKTLSAVSIRQYERSVTALDRYLQTIELGLQAALRNYKLPLTGKNPQPRHRGVVVFGSDQGLCGKFNEHLARFVDKYIRAAEESPDNVHFMVVGAKVAARLESLGYRIEEQFWVPGSVSGINQNIYQILIALNEWRQQYEMRHVDMYFNRHAPATAGEPYRRTLLPFENKHLRHMAEKKWPGRSLPQYRTTPPNLFNALMQQYFFVSLFRAQTESLESEQASRLRSMQNAEKNIEEHLEELNGRYRMERQSSITAELLDLVAGFKSSSGLKRQSDEAD